MNPNLFSKLLRSFFHNPFHKLLSGENALSKGKKRKPKSNKPVQIENLEARLVPSTAAPENLPPSRTTQVVFVDSLLPNKQNILGDSILQDGNTEVIEINSMQNGLEQIANALSTKTNLEAIHVFSHGQQGKIILGNVSIGTNEIDANLDYLNTIGKSLNADGDILLYGCFVAEGFVGQDFVNRLAEATGADVAASDDATGNIVAGGDWQLEQQSGPIESVTLDADLGANVLANYTITIGQNASRLSWQGRANSNPTTWSYAQPFTDDQHVAYFAKVWRERTWEYSVPTRWFLGIPTGWGKRTETSRWQENEYRLYNYGSGTRYGTQSFNLPTSAFSFDVTPTSLIKNWTGQGQNQGNAAFRYNLAIYKDSFDPSNPLQNLVAGGTSLPTWVGFTDGLAISKLQGGTYVAVLSYSDYITQDNYNAYWASLNSNAEQLWGSFNLNVVNLNRAPGWSTVSNQSLSGAGSKSFSIPWSAVSDADGDAITVTAALASGQPLPSWLSFNPNSLTFTGNPPANTGTLVIRLSANDGQATSTRDFSAIFTSDNDTPAVANIIPTQSWFGSGGFTYPLPAGTFTDADPSGTSFSYSATLASGSALPPLAHDRLRDRHPEWQPACWSNRPRHPSYSQRWLWAGQCHSGHRLHAAAA